MGGSGYYGWVNERRRGHATAAADSSVGADTEVPVERCRAPGGPANCSVHGDMLRRELAEADVISTAGDVPCVKDAAAALYERAEREGFTDDVLREMDALDEKVERGEMKPCRMPSDSMLCGRTSGLPRWFRALYHVLAAKSNTDAGGQSQFGDKTEIARENGFMRRYAEARGLWSDDLVGDAERACGPRFAEGGESYCYWADDRRKVLKVNSTVFNRQPTRAMERIMLHNFYFPESALTVNGVGIMRRTGRHAGDYMAFNVAQRAFDFADREVTEAERNAMMAERGFVPRNGSSKVFVSGDAERTMTIGDLNVNNIRWTKGGELVVPDALEALNLPCYGRSGRYDLERPPERIFTTEHLESRRSRITRNGAEAMASDEMPKMGGTQTANEPICTMPAVNPYYDPEKEARLDAESANVTWESLRRNAFIRHDPEAVGAE